LESINSTPTEFVADNGNEGYETRKPDFVDKIEGFDIKNLSPENLEFMAHTIQDVFRENFPVSKELIDQIPERMMYVSTEDFVRLREDEKKEEIETELGFYNRKLEKMLINVPRHETPGTLFSTMFHECLHFVSIQSGAGLTGDFLYPDIGDKETAEMHNDLDEGVRVMVEGTTQNITHAYVIDKFGFQPQPQMFSYEPEYQVTNAIWLPFSKEERMKAYFNTPIESLRVRVESAFSEKPVNDTPTGMFANILVDVARVTRDMKTALDSWMKDNNPDPVEDVLNDVRHAVGNFIVRELEIGRRELDDDEEVLLQPYLEPYKAKE